MSDASLPTSSCGRRATAPYISRKLARLRRRLVSAGVKHQRWVLGRVRMYVALVRVEQPSRVVYDMKGA
jgi:hypothetical protein